MIPDDRSGYISCDFAGSHLESTRFRYGKTTVNQAFQIPVVTPLLENLILIQVWVENRSGKQMLAQGRLVFTKLKTKPLAPRWVNLYGTGADQLSVGDPESVFIGRIFIAARVWRAKSIESLRPAERILAR